MYYDLNSKLHFSCIFTLDSKSKNLVIKTFLTKGGHESGYLGGFRPGLHHDLRMRLCLHQDFCGSGRNRKNMGISGKWK